MTVVLIGVLARASVALPFVMALGFALAAVTVTLVERYGQVMAYRMVAGSLAIIGVVAAAVVSVKEQEEDEAEQAAQDADTGEVVSEATAQAVVQTPIALLGALLACRAVRRRRSASPAFSAATFLWCCCLC